MLHSKKLLTADDEEPNLSLHEPKLLHEQRHKVHTPPPVPHTAQELALVDTHHGLVKELLLHHGHSAHWALR